MHDARRRVDDYVLTPSFHFAAAQIGGIELPRATSCAAGRLLDDIATGRTTRRDVELVIAHHHEDLAWSEPYARIRTVYTKGTTLDEAALRSSGTSMRRLPNVAKESFAYITHIVANYDSLAERTVFMHGTMPSCGFFGGVLNVSGGFVGDFIDVGDVLAGQRSKIGGGGQEVRRSSLGSPLRKLEALQ